MKRTIKDAKPNKTQNLHSGGTVARMGKSKGKKVRGVARVSFDTKSYRIVIDSGASYCIFFDKKNS